MNEEEIKKYYEEVEFNPLFSLDPTFFKFRQLRFLCEGKNGPMWHIVQDTIKNADDLKNYILKLIERKIIPLKCYYMPAQFGNPRDVMGKKTKVPFLGFHWIVFEFDVDKISGTDKLETMRLQALKLISFLKNKAFKLFYVVTSGQRGIHLAFHLPIWEQRGDKENYLNYFKLLCEQIKKEGIEIDATTTLQSDLQGIFKIPLTLSINIPCTIIYDTLESSQKFKRAMKGVASTSRPKLKQANARTKVRASPQFYQANSISSAINGTKNRHVLILDFKDKYVNVKRKIERIIKVYKTAFFAIFKTKNGYRAICPEAFDWPRVRKILINSGCDKAFISTYKDKKFITGRVSAKHDFITNKSISPAPKFVEIIKGNKNKPCSKAHISFLQIYANIQVENLIGNENLSIINYTGGE